MRTVAAILTSIVALISGCSGDLILNLTEESQRTTPVTIINNTGFRAIFTLGVFDDLDRRPPGQVSFQQFRIEPLTSAGPVPFGCFRDMGVGTQKLLDRIVDTDSDSVASFDEEAFILGVGFSSAPAGSPGEGQPDAGTAEPVVLRLGVNYTCDDQVFFTLEEAGDGTFRIDFEVIQAEEDDA